MAKDSLPDLSPAALARLVAGMTPAEVEAVIGPYHRPNLYHGRIGLSSASVARASNQPDAAPGSGQHGDRG